MKIYIWYLGWRETQLTSMNSGMNFWPCGVYGKVASNTVSIGLPSEIGGKYSCGSKLCPEILP